MTTYKDENFNSYNSQTLTANAVEKECRMQKKVYDCGKEKNIFIHLPCVWSLSLLKELKGNQV